MKLAAYAEAELAGEDVVSKFPTLWRHIQRCEECGALYADLLEITLLEESGELPIPEKLPEPNLSFLSSKKPNLYELVNRLAERIASRIVPKSQTEIKLLSEAFFERIQALGDQFEVQSQAQLVLAFGTENSTALTILAATYITTRSLLDKIEQLEKAPKRDEEELTEEIVEEIARREASKAKLPEGHVERFAEEYKHAFLKYLPIEE
jgi:hypothetical protein